MTDRYTDLNPSAVTAALRSFPRRFRGTLSADPTKDRDEIAVLRTPDGRSVREVIAGTAHALATLGEATRRVLLSDGTSVPALAVASDAPAAPAAPDDGATLSALLDRLDEAASSVADPIASAPSAALLRTGTAPDGAAVTALDIARQAVRIGAGNLRATEKAMQAAGVEVGSDGDDNDG